MTIDPDKLAANSISLDELIARDLEANPSFRDHWERTAFARALSVEVIRARMESGLDQAAFADRLGLPLAIVEELEDGEVDPELETLRMLAERLGFQFAVTVTLAAPRDPNSAPPALHTELKQSAA